MWLFSRPIKNITFININPKALDIYLLTNEKTNFILAHRTHSLTNLEIIDNHIFNITKISTLIKNFITDYNIKRPIINFCLENIYESLSSDLEDNKNSINSIMWQKYTIENGNNTCHYQAGITSQIITQIYIISHLVNASIDFISGPNLLYCKVLELFNKKLKVNESEINLEIFHSYLKNEIRKLIEYEDIKLNSFTNMTEEISGVVLAFYLYLLGSYE